MRLNTLNKHQLITLAGVLCFFLLAYTNANPAEIAPHWLQFLLLYSGIALVIWGLSSGNHEATFQWSKISRQELFWVSGVLILALALRLWELGTKVRVPVDELLPMTEILALWNNPHLPMISQFGFFSLLTRLFASWQAGSVALFGRTLLALRIPSAIIGTLTVGAVYFLGRVLFNRRTALIGALLLATYPPHLHFSRIGILNIADPLFGTLAFAFIGLAFKSNGRMAWVLGGVTLGLTQYFYEGGRLLYPGLIVIWVIFTLVSNRRDIRKWTRGLLIYGAVACLIAAPIYFTLAQSNNPLSSRLNTLALTGNDWLGLLMSQPGSPAFDWLTQHLTGPFLLFINRPDPTPYYGGDTALILIFLLPAFFTGLFWSARLREGRGLLLWFLCTLAGNLLMAGSALAPRYVIVFPAVALLMAVGITQTAAYLPKRYQWKVVFIYVTFCLAAQTIYYFGPHLDHYMQQLVPGRDGYDALFRAADLPSGTAVYLITPPSNMTESYAQNLLAFLSEDKIIHLIEDPNTFDFSAIPDASAYAFFVPSDEPSLMNILAQRFDLSAPEYSVYPLAQDKAYTLYLGTLKSQTGTN